MEKDLFERADFLYNLFDAIPSLTFIVDEDVRVHHLNIAVSDLVGLSENQEYKNIRGGELLKCINSFDVPEGCGRSPKCTGCLIRNSVKRAFAGEKVYRETGCFRFYKDNNLVEAHLKLTASPVIFEQNKYVLLVLEDITDQKHMEDTLRQANQLLARQAVTDQLTGVYNRAKFYDVIDMEISRAVRLDSPLSVVMFDIDNFKQINDTYGHHFGDDVIKNIADTVKSGLRKHDYLIRWGGEEFMLLLPHTNLQNSTMLAERLRQRIENYKMNDDLTVTCSFGVTTLHPDDDFNKLTTRADGLLYKAKNSGRNCVITSE
ncbi:MAG: diguanylate cyclase [Dissulfurispiraceae bacterium]|nr:diguanylate cyclase [Dissulfurispiraceae bacterium]